MLLPVAIAGDGSVWRRETIGAGALLGLLNNAAYLGLTFSALQFVRPAVVVVIVSCAPFATTLAAALSGVERLDRMKLLGVAIGFVGVLVIAGWDFGGGDLTGIALAAAGTAAFSFGTVMFRARATRLPIAGLNFWQSVAGATALAPIAILYGRGLGAASLLGVSAILYLAVVVTIGGMGLWMILIRTSGAGAASSYHLLNPIFGALLSALILRAPLRAADFLGAGVVAFGLFLTIKAKSRGASEAKAETSSA
jgi:drug/metabolite transporter (DMT)-like permease